MLATQSANVRCDTTLPHRVIGVDVGTCYSPAVPDALDFLVPRDVLLERVDVVSDFELHDISVHEVLVSRSVGPGRYVGAAR